ncbi:hypothetical protein Rhe02_93790 [Rhizocola hellebori]|uniref:Secreted protein n=1 Tax=Rhizocola hellebori TaxID=1392758 RepID=A0A8J3QJP9_9ACTN|nr:hypothetical protein [Rhizocola hellebori]GIH11312.1 hypothetical protein Rhe02_93790 [Rhizocola hellebori]
MLSISVQRWLIIPLVASAAVLAVPTAASAKPIQFFEERAEAFWEVPHACADGSTVPGTLLVSTTRAFSAPDTEDPTPTARLQFLAVCPGGFSFSWGAPAVPATITSNRRLKHLTANGTGVARDILGVSHPVTFDVAWQKAGPLERTVNAPGSITKERVQTADGVVTFDGTVLFDGPSNHPTRPAPFIRVDIEK